MDFFLSMKQSESLDFHSFDVSASYQTDSLDCQPSALIPMA